MKRLPAGLRLIGIGWYVALCIVLGIVGGLWLDDRVQTLPLFTLIGLFAGLIAAFVGIYRMVKETVEEDSQETSDEP